MSEPQRGSPSRHGGSKRTRRAGTGTATATVWLQFFETLKACPASVMQCYNSVIAGASSAVMLLFVGIFVSDYEGVPSKPHAMFHSVVATAVHRRACSC